MKNINTKIKKCMALFFLILGFVFITKYPVYAYEIKTIEQECNGDEKESFFAIEDFDYSDSTGIASDEMETKTDSYLYGRHRLWISLSRVGKENYPGRYYYALLITGRVYSEGKHSSSIWFSTKGVSFDVVLNDADAIFVSKTNDGSAFMNPEYIIYGNVNNQNITLNRLAPATSHISFSTSNYSQKQLKRVNHSNNAITVDDKQKRKLVIDYVYSGYSDNRSLPCAGTFNQNVALIFESSVENASVTVGMKATFFKDKKLGNNYTKTSDKISLTRGIYND